MESKQPSSASQKATDTAAKTFVLRMALALQRFGLPSHRLEETMDLLDRQLCLQSRFYSSPTMVMATFGRGLEQRTLAFRPEGEELNLEKLDLLFALARQVGLGKLSPEQGLDRLAAIVEGPGRYGPLATTLCLVLSSSGAARLFGGGWREVLVAAAISLMLGLLILSLGRFPATGRLLALIASFLAMVLATAASLWLGPISIYVATVTGLIVLIPGLTLTTAVIELAQGNAVSGTSRFAMATITFLMIAFGMALGSQVAQLIPEVATTATPQALPVWTSYLAQLVVPLSFVVLFKAGPRDAPWVLLAGLIAYQAAVRGSAFLGPELGTFTAAFLLALYANAFARVFERPSSLVLVPGIMLLVPGSVGYRSLHAMLMTEQTLLGLETAFVMILVAVALVSGLIFASILLPPESPIISAESLS